MNKKKLFIILLLITACSSSDTGENENQNFAQFDSTFSAYSGFTYQYTIRVKVFNNEAEADCFIANNKSKIKFNLNKRFNSSKNQYFIESESINSRFKAEELIADLKLNEEYNTAAIIIRKIEFEEGVKDSKSN
jgi:hypothetical protein